MQDQESFGSLPPDLWAKVAHRFSPQALAHSSTACSGWAKAMNSDELWTLLCDSHFPGAQNPSLGSQSCTSKEKYTFHHQLRSRWAKGKAKAHRFIEPRSVLCSDLKGNKLISGSFDGELRLYPVNPCGLYSGDDVEQLGYVREQDWQAQQGTNITLGACSPAENNTNSPAPATNARQMSEGFVTPPVNAVAIMSNDFVATGLRNHKVSVWNLSSGESGRVVELTGHIKQVLSLCTVGAADGQQMLASGGADRSVCLWDLGHNTEGPMWTITGGHRGVVNGIASAESCLATAAGDGMIRVFDVRIAGGDTAADSASIMLRAGSGLWPATCLTFRQDNHNHIFAGAGDGGVRLMDLRMPDSWMHENTICQRAVTAVATRGERYCCGTVDGGVLVFDLNSAENFEVKAHSDRVSSVHLAERALISCSQDRSLIIHDFSPI